jgi:arylsulfatase
VPNIVLIYADDLGYGDLGCYGSKIPTPNIDQMAAEGVRFTQFYSASGLCTPSRAALMTGRYPVRVGLPYVLQARDPSGLPESETTIAHTLRRVGYRTMCVGKWHLGSREEYLPTRRGFDEYFGIPYSNDMWPLPMMRNTFIAEETAAQETLTRRYTEQAVGFINRFRDWPFFLYMPHSAPHIPLAVSSTFRGNSNLGRYADVVSEMDWSVGEVLKALKENGLENNTLVMFTSDNGPWFQGNAGGLRGRKAETWEGGMREPFIARLPGVIPESSISTAVATTMDILPTLARVAGAPLPETVLDGVDLWPVLSGERPEVEREMFLYFDGWNLQCARWGRWKLHVARNNTPAWVPIPPGGQVNLPLPSPELYDLESDPQESSDCAADRPEIVARIRERIEWLLPGFPEQVQTAWRQTMNRRVGYTPSGALPAEERPPEAIPPDLTAPVGH